MDWQPIETAPRDGTRFLVWWEKDKYASIVWWLKGYGAFTNGATDRCDTPVGFAPSWFTHWMPLPAPPIT